MIQELFDQAVAQLSGSPTEQGVPRISSLLVSDRHTFLSHQFADDEPVNVRSIAKPIVGLAIGAAIDKGLEIGGQRVTLESPVWPLVERFAPPLLDESIDHWKQVQLIDLLRITFGQTVGIMFSKDLAGRDPDSLLAYVLDYPADATIGRDFTYSNAGTFLISAIVTEGLGIDLDDFVQDHILSRLGISKPRWDRYGKYVAGCTGLWLRNGELHKVGHLLRDEGRFDGNQVVPAEFVREMRTPQVASPTHRYVNTRAFPKWSYGLNLWICEDGTFYCDGTDGQYLIVFPASGRVVSVLAHEPDSVRVSDALALFK